MKAIELSDFGPEHIRLCDRPDPEPGAGEVLVRMRAAALNYRDNVVVKGGYGSGIQAPLILLSDGAGEIVGLGEGVQDLAVGDRVMAHFFQSWADGKPSAPKLAESLGGPLDGTACQYRVLRASGVAKLPDYLSFEEGASLPCAAVTAWNSLCVLDQVGANDVVLVQGTGGVSLFALQFAKMLGATVIATSSSDEKLERARALGADHTINYRSEPEWGKAARKLAGADGVTHVIEVGGAGTLGQSLRCLAIGGVISLIGVLAGAKTSLHLPHIFFKQARLHGVVVGSGAMGVDMLRAMHEHQITPVLDERSFELPQTAEALKYLASGAHFGKVSVRIGD